MTNEDRKLICRAYRKLLTLTADTLQNEYIRNVRSVFHMAEEKADLGKYKAGGFPAILHSLQVATIVADEIGLGRSSVIAAALYEVLLMADIPTDTIKSYFGDTTQAICTGLMKVRELYGKQSAVENDNFR